MQALLPVGGRDKSRLADFLEQDLEDTFELAPLGGSAND